MRRRLGRRDRRRLVRCRLEGDVGPFLAAIAGHQSTTSRSNQPGSRRRSSSSTRTSRGRRRCAGAGRARGAGQARGVNGAVFAHVWRSNPAGRRRDGRARRLGHVPADHLQRVRLVDQGHLREWHDPAAVPAVRAVRWRRPVQPVGFRRARLHPPDRGRARPRRRCGVHVARDRRRAPAGTLEILLSRPISRRGLSSRWRSPERCSSARRRGARRRCLDRGRASPGRPRPSASASCRSCG